MEDLRVQDSEEWIGEGHPEKADSLNRLFLSNGKRRTDGTNNYNVFNEQESAPDTGAEQMGLYAADLGSGLVFLLRGPDSGTTIQIG